MRKKGFFGISPKSKLQNSKNRPGLVVKKVQYFKNNFLDKKNKEKMKETRYLYTLKGEKAGR